MTDLQRLFLLFFWPINAVPALAWAQQPVADEIVVELGTPVPVPLDQVAERLQAELPDAAVRVGPADTAAAGTVTMALDESGQLRIVYRDASGREATRIVADTRDPAAVAAAVAMIVANLHRSQLDSVLGDAPSSANAAVAAPPVASEPPIAEPAPPVAEPSPPAAPPVRAAVTPPASAHLVRAAEPAREPGWVVDFGGLYAVVAVSGVVGAGYQFDNGVRVGGRASIAYVPESESSAYTLDGVVQFTTSRRRGHFDFGMTTGLLAVDNGTLLGLHLGPFTSFVYGLTPSVGIGIRAGLDIALIDGEATLWPTAAIFAELPI